MQSRRSVDDFDPCSLGLNKNLQPLDSVADAKTSTSPEQTTLDDRLDGPVQAKAQRFAHFEPKRQEEGAALDKYAGQLHLYTTRGIFTFHMSEFCAGRLLTTLGLERENLSSAGSCYLGRITSIVDQLGLSTGRKAAILSRILQLRSQQWELDDSQVALQPVVLCLSFIHYPFAEFCRRA